MSRMKYLLQREISNLKGLTFREKAAYIWEYYKITVSVLGLILVLAVTGTAFYSGRGKTAMYMVLVNAAEQEENPITEMLQKAEIIPAGHEVEVEDSYRLSMENSGTVDPSTVQVLAALFSAGDMDLFAADEQVYQRYAGQDGFEDLSLYLSEDLLKAHEADLYYATVDGGQILSGIWLRQGSPLHQAGYYSEDVIIGITAHAVNLDYAVKALEYFLE